MAQLPPSFRKMPPTVPSKIPWVRGAKAVPVAPAPMPELPAAALDDIPFNSPTPPFAGPAAPTPAPMRFVPTSTKPAPMPEAAMLDTAPVEPPAPYYGTAPLKKQADKYAAYKRETNRSIGSPPPRSKDPADHRERSIDRSSAPVRGPTIEEVAAIYERYRTTPRGEDDEDEGFTPESTEEDNDLGPPQPYVPEPPKPKPTHITKTVFEERDGHFFLVRITEALPPPPSSGLMSSRVGVLPAAEGRPPMPSIRPRSPPATGRDT